MSNSIRSAAAVIAALTAVFSCVNNDRTLGEQFVSSDYILKADSSTLSLPVCQRVRDTVQAVSYSKMMVGYISDEVYGTTVIDGASVVIPIPDSAYLGINPRLVDVYLNLAVDSTYYYSEGDDAIPQNIYLYEIVRDFASDSLMIFNNSFTPEYLSSEPVSLGSPMVFGESTVKIQLKKEFGEKLLATSPAEFKDISLFLDRIYGMYVKSDKPDRDVPGGRINYMSLSSSVITVEYVMNDPEQDIVDKDTTVTFLFGYTYALNQFSAGSKHLVTGHPEDVLYVDGLSGVKPVIPALELKDRIDSWADDVCRREGCDRESILLSQARLIFPYDMPDDFEKFEYEHPLQLFPFTTDVTAADSSALMVPLDNISSAGGGVLDRSHGYYYCNVTPYVQEMITKGRADISHTDDLWICPVGTLYNSSTYTTSYVLDVDSYPRVILKGPGSDTPPRLELVYGILKDW